MFYGGYHRAASTELTVAAQLAKLLAHENLSVEFRAVKTAFIDLKRRVAVFPIWVGISPELRHLLIVHETGHAHDTPVDGWEDAINKIAQRHHSDPHTANRAKLMVKNFLNVIEDPRIDKRQKRRYPGCRRDYAIGYRELGERDFFGINKLDVNQLTFIDRANIFFKSAPGQYPLQFTASEEALLARIGATETWDDVVALTDEIYGLSKGKRKIVTVIEEECDDGEDGRGKKGKAGEAGDEGEAGKAAEGEGAEGEGDDEGEGETGKGQDSDDDEGERRGRGDDLGGDDDGDDDGDAGSDDGKGSGAGDIGDDGGHAGPNDEIPECLTEDAVREALEKLAAKDTSNIIYFDLPKAVHSEIVDDFKVVLPQMLTTVDYRYLDKDKLVEKYHEWRKEENDTISFLVKEFESKKAADIQARTQIAKTGIIDTNKLHGYRYDDNLFKKNTTIAAGKNHGFIMILDWSSSMIDHLNQTMRQLFSLTMFCKRVGVPFEVYLFRSTTSKDRHTMKEQFIHSNNVTYINYGKFKMRNVLSSRMTTGQLNNAYEVLWCASRMAHVVSDPLNGTPLNQAILCADKLINDFRRKTGVQIVNTIILTDGGSEGATFHTGPLPIKAGADKYVIRDPVTKMMYTRDAHFNGDDTKVMLEVLRARTGTNLIGFFLAGSLNEVPYTILSPDSRRDKAIRKQWKDERYLAITTAGYDDYYLMNVLGAAGSYDELKIEKGMSKNKITKAFSASHAKKLTSRALLTRFIALISKNKA